MLNLKNKINGLNRPAEHTVWQVRDILLRYVFLVFSLVFLSEPFFVSYLLFGLILYGLLSVHLLSLETSVRVNSKLKFIGEE